MKIKNQMKGLLLTVLWLCIPLVQTFGFDNLNSSISVVLISPNAGNNVYEGCGDPYILIDVNDLNPGQDYTFSVALTGTAQIDLDYDIEDELLLFNTINSNNGQFIIPLNIVDDGIPEFPETILVFVQPFCTGCPPSELLIHVHDPLDALAVQTEDTIWICSSDTLFINPEISNAFVQLDYEWSDGSTMPTYVDPSPETGLVELLLTDACGAEIEVDYFIQTLDVEANMDNSNVIACGSLDNAELPVSFSGPGPYELVFSYNGLVQDTIKDIQSNPCYLPILGEGEYTLEYVTGSACEGSVSGSRNLILKPFSIELNTSIVTCYGGNDGTASIQINEGTAPYSIIWENGSNDTLISGLESDYYTVSLTDFAGCVFEDSIYVPENPPIAFFPEIIQQPNCIDSSGGVIAISFECESYDYEWSIATEDPMFLDSLDIGEYIVTATNDLGCFVTDTIPLNGDFAAPSINIEGIDTLNCLNNFGNLEVVGLNNGIHDFLWESNDGLITGNPNSNNILVGVGGTYEVFVQNLQNGCQDSSMVQVFEDFVYPDVATAVFDTIDCYNGGVTLYGDGSSLGGDFLYVWSTFDGQLNGAINTINAEALVGGLYTLSVINANNGCISSSDLIVQDVIDNPDILLSTDGNLTCVDSIVVIDATGSDVGTNFIYNWTAQNGAVINDPAAVSIATNAAGTYTLEIQNTDNGCSSQQSIDVILDDVIPELNIQDPGFFSCFNDSIIIETQYAGNTDDLIYSWSSADTVQLISNDELAVAHTPGYINLQIENVQNGCVNSYDFELYEDYNAPDLQIEAQNQLLNCTIGTLMLNAENNSLGSFAYQWTGLEGQPILSGQNSLNPQISQTGNYELYAIDLNTGCTDIDTIEIAGDTQQPDISFSEPAILTCLLTETVIIADTSGYPDVSIDWSMNTGNQINIINGLSTEILAPGVYNVSVLDNQNNCVSDYTLEVLADTIAPQLIVDPAANITCVNNQVILDATNSDTGDDYEIGWQLNPDLVVNSLNPYLATVSASGWYEVSLINMDNGCSTTDAVEVLADLAIPLAEVLPIPVINCLDTIVSIGVQISSDYEYLWSSVNGIIDSAMDTAVVLVSENGLYDLLITDPVNGCDNTVSILVESDTVAPEMNLLPYTKLDCSNSTTVLELNVNGDFPTHFEWAGPSGGIINSEDQFFAEVQSPGVYTVEVTNLQNNCTWDAAYPVIQDVQVPVVNISGVDTLTCIEEEIELLASTDNDALYLFEWTSSQAELAGPLNTLELVVNEAATYQIEVSNPLNGCSQTAIVVIEGDQETPAVTGILGDDITCDVDKVWLEPSLTSTGPYLYSWSSADGNIISQTNEELILVDQAGIYELLIENTVNGCSATSSIQVEAFKEAPEIALEDLYILNCDLPVLEFQLNLDPNRIEVLWFDENGSVIETGGADVIFESEGLFAVSLDDTFTGCATEESFEITDHRLLSMALEIEQPICSDPYGMIEIVSVEGSIEPFDYRINGDELSSSDPLVEFLDAGNYEVEVEDPYGCLLSQEVIIKDLPILKLGIENSSLIEEGDNYQVSMQLNFDESTISSVEWSPAIDISCVDCLEPLLSPEEYRLYTVEVLTEEGCAVEHQIQIFVRDDRSIFTPNIFTPNGDGNNDHFMVYATDDYVSIETFKIYDRWGELVFSNNQAQLNNTEDGWDGTFLNRELQSAVFTWYVELLDDKGNREQFTGDIMLYR